MTTQIFLGQIMGKYAGLAAAEKKQTYLYLEPLDNSQQIYVSIISKLHCTLLSPLLHFSGRVNSRWRKKKRLFVHWEKQAEREHKSENQSAETLCFPSSWDFFNTQQTACRRIAFKRRKKCLKQQTATFQRALKPKNFSCLEKCIQGLILFHFHSYNPFQSVSGLVYPRRLRRRFKCFKLQKLCHSVQNKLHIMFSQAF